MSRVSHDAHARHEVVDEGREPGQPREPAEGLDDVAAARQQLERGDGSGSRGSELAEHDHEHGRAFAQPLLPALTRALGSLAARAGLVERLADGLPGSPQVAREPDRQDPPHDMAASTAEDEDLGARASAAVELAGSSVVDVQDRAVTRRALLGSGEVGVGECGSVIVERSDARVDQGAAPKLVAVLARPRVVEVCRRWECSGWWVLFGDFALPAGLLLSKFLVLAIVISRGGTVGWLLRLGRSGWLGGVVTTVSARAAGSRSSRAG